MRASPNPYHEYNREQLNLAIEQYLRNGGKITVLPSVMPDPLGRTKAKIEAESAFDDMGGIDDTEEV